jgi:IS30 family transposase
MGQGQDNTKHRKWKHLNEKDRYKIEALAGQGINAAAIGRSLSPKRDRRTIEREIKRGSVVQRKRNYESKDPRVPEYIDSMEYLADVGQRVYEERSSNKGRQLKIGHDHALANHIEDKIKNEKWSPDAVLGKIKEEGKEFKASICTKTLYSYIDKGIFAGISNKDLLIKRNGKKRGYKKVRTVALNNKKGKSITERPAEAEERSEQGHWEIDLVVGRKGTKAAIMTLVDRKTRKSLYVLIKNKTQKEVLAAIKRVRRREGGNFDKVFKTITADNGSEFLDGEGIKKASNCEEVYYAHPYSSWERGSNENGNRMLRRFVPKGANIGEMTSKELQRIEDWINNYPRKIFGYKTANQMAA